MVTETALVPDPKLSIRDGAVAAWPGAWQGKNLRDILVALGYDVDRPWHGLPKRTRDWILFTDEQPVVEVHPTGTGARPCTTGGSGAPGRTSCIRWPAPKASATANARCAS